MEFPGDVTRGILSTINHTVAAEISQGHINFNGSNIALELDTSTLNDTGNMVFWYQIMMLTNKRMSNQMHHR